jgi:hypothetical protein
VAGQLVHATYSRPLNLRLDASQIVLSDTDATSTKAGAATVPRVSPRTLAMLGVAVRVLWLRWAALAAGLGCALAAGLVLYARRRAGSADDGRLGAPGDYWPDPQQGPPAGRIVRVRRPDDEGADDDLAVSGPYVSGPTATRLSVVHVESMHDLMALADQTGEPVLTYGIGDDAAFILEYGARRYRYAPTPPRANPGIPHARATNVPTPAP